MGMIARHSEADVNVIGLIGAREGEAGEFLERHLGAEGRAKSVVIVAVQTTPTLARVKAASLAAKIAEDFRDAGQHVLLIVDSLTRVAMAQRDVGLAIGEATGVRGYTPSALSLVPHVLERAGVSEKGSITGVFSVLAETYDRDDPVADLTRSIVPGEIVLSRELALQNHYPAIDVPASLSRVQRELLDTDQLALAARAREALAIYRKHQDLICLGEIRPGMNPAIDHAIRCHIVLQEFLRQEMESGFSANQSWKLLAEAMASAQTPSAQGRKSSQRKKK
jgi:flagellum-specific ATP synthase